MNAKTAVPLDARSSILKPSHVPGRRALEALAALGTIANTHSGLFELDEVDRSLYPMQLAQVRDHNVVGEIRGTYGDVWKPSLSLYDGRVQGHNGVDIYAPVGVPIVATVAGRLQFKDDADKLGKRAWLSFRWKDRDWRFIYGHLDRFEGKERKVSRGEVIGYAGCSGNADRDKACSKPNRCGLSSAHVHFMLVNDSIRKIVNPLDHLDWELRYREDGRAVPCEKVIAPSSALADAASNTSPVERILLRQGAILEQLGRIRELLTDKKLAGATALEDYRSELLSLLGEGVVTLHTAGNVDTTAGPKDRASAFLALAEACSNDLDASADARQKATIVRFLARLAWHEGAQLLHRSQLAKGPARGFSQFEAHRAKDALEYAKQKKLLPTLETVSGETSAALEAATKALPSYGAARSAFFPAGNLIERLLLENDLFGVYLTRIAFKKVPESVPGEIAAQADYWFKYWKVTDPDPPGVRQKFIRSAQQLDALIV
ncbi:MAG TPA: M23 family metallopeptidase [Rhodocyclaceae bacterium]|nr:M23 family metallopeptidase [Rhodocyclaceae bacterium]